MKQCFTWAQRRFVQVGSLERLYNLGVCKYLYESSGDSLMSKVSKIEKQPTEVEHITRIYAWEEPVYEHINYWLNLKGMSFRYKSTGGFAYAKLYAFLKKNREQIAQELADEAGINLSFKEFEWMLEQKGEE